MGRSLEKCARSSLAWSRTGLRSATPCAAPGYLFSYWHEGLHHAEAGRFRPRASFWGARGAIGDRIRACFKKVGNHGPNTTA